MAVKPVWSVVREILTADLSLTADQVIAKAKARGVKSPDAAIRETVYNVRKKLKKKAAAPAPRPVPAAARQTAAPAAVAPTTSAVVRSILSGALDLTADEVVTRAKAQGLTATEKTIRSLVYNIRGELKKAANQPAQALKAVTTAPEAAPEPKPAPVAAAPVALPAAGLSAVLSNVALVNDAVRAAGGVDAARQVAEAVRSCGGPEAFAQYLDLVAGIRTP